jgi:hypothetical protein
LGRGGVGAVVVGGVGPFVVAPLVGGGWGGVRGDVFADVGAAVVAGVGGLGRGCYLLAGHGWEDSGFAG